MVETDIQVQEAQYFEQYMAEKVVKSFALKRLKWLILVALFLLAIFAFRSSYKVALIASGYHAKTLCSGVFVSRRDADSIITQDIQADMLSILKHFKADIDYDKRIVKTTFWGMAERVAVFRKGLGCTLVINQPIREVLQQGSEIVFSIEAPSSDLLWPEGSRADASGTFPGVNRRKLDEAIDDAFSEPDGYNLKRTRAVVVVHKGRIVGERYAAGFGPDTPQLGWSMAKSVMNALVGVLVGEKKMELGADKLLPVWQDPKDMRSKIVVSHLLRMTSGLKFDEAYNAMLSDVRVMLFLEGNQSAFAASRELASPPGTKWSYSSGSTNVLSEIIRKSVGGALSRYLIFPQNALFKKLGMSTAVIETDETGIFVGSSYMYASARDWARIGLLYLNDGIWQGERILPEGWVDYTRSPALVSAPYGAQFWLRMPRFLLNRRQSLVRVPEDGFYMLGHDGQMVAIIPSRELVVVRLGISRRKIAWSHETFLSNILSAIEGGGDVDNKGGADRDGEDFQDGRGRWDAMPVP